MWFKNKIWFLYLHYILQYNFWIGFQFEKLKSLYCYLEKTQSNSMRPIAVITIRKYYIINYNPVSIYCVRLAHQ